VTQTTQARTIASRRMGSRTRMSPGGHALVIDSGWREVADTALAFVQRYTK